MIETSTLTEEGVIQVKNEVRRSKLQTRSLSCSGRCGSRSLVFSGLRPAPRQPRRDQDEGQEGP